MQTDLASQKILSWLQNITTPTLWYADESAASILATVQANDLLTLVTNRYDIYEAAQAKHIRSIFSDFNSNDYPEQQFSRIIYRISKEKALVNYLCNQASHLLNHSGELILSAYKQEGIKSYATNLKKIVKAKGQLDKNGNVYIGHFSKLNPEYKLDNKRYASIQKVINTRLEQGYYYSKPGVFGWDKVDKGTEILLETAETLFKGEALKQKTLLDLGCGYGWIFLNMDKYQLASIVATDNNAAAMLCANKNAEQMATPTTIIASDCANSIDQKFDFILCNPPFHQGFKHSQLLTKKFIEACKYKLATTGKALFVLNEFVAISDNVKQAKLKESLLTKKAGFKVILLEHQL